MNEQYRDLLERIYRNLPRVYRVMDIEQKMQLKRYLEVITAGGLHPLYEETKGLLDINDFDRTPKEHLPFLAEFLGFQFPYDLDEQTQRTYIKTAVAAYKRKGTASALLFMIRELTRFNTTLDVDDNERRLDVRVEVDQSRQDFEKILDKVKFIVDEYAPPYKELNIINVFTWIEERYPFVLAEWMEELTVLMPNVDVDYEAKTGAWFGANIGLTNTTPTASGELYPVGKIQEDFTENITMV